MIVQPHKKISREVTEADMPRVITDIMEMTKIIIGSPTCIALAHPQVDDEDPLRLYVTKSGEFIINPIVTRHANYCIPSIEGCMTFPGREHIKKERWRLMEISYQTIMEGILTARIEKTLVGFPAIVAQHEIDHLNGIYCYDL